MATTMLKNETRIAEMIANRVLDESGRDPDEDICVLARQFLRSREHCRAEVIEECAKVADKVTDELEAGTGEIWIARRITAAIRSLKEQPE